MAEGRLEFELVSPERLLLSERVEMVVVPGVEGDFGVLEGHAPVISNVRPGVIHVFEGGAVKSRIFVAGGVAEVTPERCTVLAEDAAPIEEIDRAALDQEISDLADDVADAADEDQRRRAEAGLAIARAKVQALEETLYQ